ncbi:type III pantothenate kinase [Rhodothermus profundi]|uniref:Type III pantothenate kinase n=1 Tax=Rhodothermus profundi TaxID=633813 RepID=A0A1M6UV42_9BACT|nr:type III pantothenate kinase [Rhodothermus profundi]SHK73068.1 pantothenate kinase [Rhodothermus profundi]
MWLALDLGNSALKGGLFDAGQLVHTFRLAAQDPSRLSEELAAELAGRSLTRAAMASVVPARTPVVQEAVQRYAKVRPALIRPDWQLPFTLAYETPHTLGTDRLAAAAAAWVTYGQPQHRPVLAILAGTALTIEVIDEQGCYQGGVIAPGPQLMQQALAQGTAQLPEVPLEWPRSPVGRSTQAAIQAGLLYGFVECVKGLLRRLSSTFVTAPVVILSGGWAALLKQHAAIDVHDPHLVLRGIYHLLELNPEQGLP